MKIRRNRDRRTESRSGAGPWQAVGCLLAGLGLAGLALAVPGVAVAQLRTVEQTEELVRSVYFEGMPEEEAREIGPEGCARLVEMLADPEELASHGQIMLAIGICRPPGGFEALRAWADTPRQGEIDRDTFRAWQALPFALGHLARHDRRALTRLEAELERSEAPAWSFRQHHGARLVSQARRAAASCLAMTGLPEAEAALERAGGLASDASFRAHLAEARQMHRRAAERSARTGADPASRGGSARGQGGRR